MKKLMVAIAAAATALGLYATQGGDPGFKSGTGFDAMTAGAKTLAELNAGDNAQETGGTWSQADSVNVEVKAWTTAIGEEYRPDQYANNITQVNYLWVTNSLEKPLTRTMTGDAMSLATADAYVDTLVKFTACDEEITTLGDAEAKIAVWVREDDVAGTTNLMITAGYITAADGSVVATNYNCGAFTGIDSWHRLTIKAIGNIAKSDIGLVGFVVFIDGNVTGTAKFSTADKGYDGYKTILNDVATLWDKNGQLFPSLRGKADGSISALAVAGQGGIDDISFTTTAPTWANKSAATITWDPATVAWVSIDGGTTKLTTGSLVIEANKLVTITAEAVGNYMITSGTGDWTPTTEDKTREVVAAKIAATVEIDGVTTTYADLALAIKRIEGASKDALLTLGGNSGAIAINRAEATDAITVTIDLAGNTITPEEDAEWGIFVDGAAVVVTDNSESVGTVNGGTAGSVASNVDVVLEAGIFKGTTGGVSGVVNGVKGDEDAKASIDDCLDDDQQWSDKDADNLYTVIEKLPEPFTVTVPALTTGLTIQSITTNGVEVVPPTAGDYTLNKDETFSMTYAPDTGYKFTDVMETGVREATKTMEIDPPDVEQIPVTGVTLDKATLEMNVGEVSNLVATVSPDTAFNREVTWEVTAGDAVTVVGGAVTAVKAGTATVTATSVADPTKSASCTVTVTAPGPVWPSDWPEDVDPAVQAKYADWAKGKTLSGDDAVNQAAFLLNVDPQSTIPELKIESITVEDDEATIVVSAGTANLENVNGILYVDAANDLTDWTTTEVDLAKDATFAEGKATFTVSAGKFMKAGVGFKAPEEPVTE